MSFDITNLLENWEYQPGQVMVRRFVGRDGVEKIQLRVDLGILQMNAEGRPDGKKPFGFESLFDFQCSRLEKHRDEHNGGDEDFVLKGEDCSRLHIEFLQYHHRYICLLQLEDYSAVIRDTERNIDLLDFVQEYAETEEMALALNQFRPQVMMMQVRAAASRALDAKDFAAAIQVVEQGIEEMRDFFRELNRPELAENAGEIVSLDEWLSDIRSKRPLSQKERLEKALTEALQNENYEKAAQVRDALRKLQAKESSGSSGGR